MPDMYCAIGPILGFTLTFAFSMTAMFAYIAASPFVLQNIIGLGTTSYSLVFATNALGLTATSVLSAKLVTRFGPLRLTSFGVASLTCLQRRALGGDHIGRHACIANIDPAFRLGFVVGSLSGQCHGPCHRAGHRICRKRIGNARRVAVHPRSHCFTARWSGRGKRCHSMGVTMLGASAVAALCLVTMTRGTAGNPSAADSENPQVSATAHWGANAAIPSTEPKRHRAGASFEA